MNRESTSQEFFENKYRQAIDPWHFEESVYEQERYAAILRALGRRRYERAFEPGCSIGVLTKLLSPYCDYLEAVDISPTAACRAQESCISLRNVTIRCGSLPQAIPDGNFELIVFSEIGYYFERKVLEEVIQTLTARLCLSGTFIAAHWLGTSADHLLSGDEVHGTIRQNVNLTLEQEQQFLSFRLDRMVRR